MSLDLQNPVELTVSQAVLALEANDARFESFCREAVSMLEGGATVFSTSPSWDLGRDGVGAGSAKGIYVCASLRDDVDNKALADLTRLVATTKFIRHVYFCSSHKLTEHRRTMLESQLVDEFDQAFDVTCLGSSQLIEAVSQEPSAFARHYGAEIRDALRAISADPADENEVVGLRLALMASSGENSIEIRRELYVAALLEILADGEGRTVTSCAKDLSDRLRLGRTIGEGAILPHLQGLSAAGLVERGGGGTYVITKEGNERIATLRAAAAERFLSGKASIRDAIETSIGSKLSEDDFARIWEILERRVASYFHARGAELVAEISALLDDRSVSGGLAPLSFVDELAEAIAATSSHLQRRSELRTAVKDMFADRTSGATDWLVRVCGSFVASCAIGLEHSSSGAIAKLLSRTTLVLDTDVVLSLLGEGEPENQGVSQIVSRWVKHRGKVYVADPVLEEVAYHASIANNDFQFVRHLIPGTPEDRLHLIENVFVRSFAELVANGTALVTHWPRYVSQFQGRSPYESSKVQSHLRAEYSVERLPPRSSELDALERDARKFLIEDAERQGFSGKITSDKAGRDARLYAGIVAYQRASRETDPGATCLLLSSARRLVRVEDRFRESGEQQMVIQISTALQLISLLPEVSLGLAAMKAFLFEDRRAGFSSDLERTVLRVIRGSREVSLPWAKRGLLMKELRDRLIQDARSAGERSLEGNGAAALEYGALSEERRERTMQLLGESLDKVAATSRLEDENAALRRENDVLRKRLEQRRRGG